MWWPPSPIRSDRQTTSLPVADNWIDEDGGGQRWASFRSTLHCTFSCENCCLHDKVCGDAARYQRIISLPCYRQPD